MDHKLFEKPVGVFLVLGICFLLSSGCGISVRQLPSGERFRVVFADPVNLCDPRQVREQTQKHEFWIRIGEEPEAEYYQGDRLCERCQASEEDAFFNGDRAYFYPENSTYVVYVEVAGSTVKVMKETDRYDVHYQPADHVEDMAAAEDQISGALQMICPEEFKEPSIQITLEPLTAQTLSE